MMKVPDEIVELCRPEGAAWISATEGTTPPAFTYGQAIYLHHIGLVWREALQSCR